MTYSFRKLNIKKQNLQRIDNYYHCQYTILNGVNQALEIIKYAIDLAEDNKYGINIYIHIILMDRRRGQSNLCNT